MCSGRINKQQLAELTFSPMFCPGLDLTFQQITCFLTSRSFTDFFFSSLDCTREQEEVSTGSPDMSPDSINLTDMSPDSINLIMKWFKSRQMDQFEGLDQ